MIYFTKLWIVVGNNITKLEGTFEGCEELADIKLPDKLQTIEAGTIRVAAVDGAGGGWTFLYCENLRKLYIPKNVNYIQEPSITFAECSKLKELIVDSNNQTYSSVNGILFDKSQKTLFYCLEEKTGSYLIPNSVTTINDYAFRGSNLTSVVIPKTVTTVGYSIFSESKVSHIYYPGTQQQWNKLLTYEYSDSLGKDDITIHYNSSGPSVTAVTIKSMPTKKTYTVGESFAPAGMILKATYDDGTAKEITSGFTYTPTGKLTTTGQQKIVVTYGGKSTGFYVTVNKAVSSVTIAKKPTKQTYTVGETFNAAGMKLKVTYADNTTAEITSGFTYTPSGKLTTAGQQKIVVSYGGKSTGFYVTVG